MQYNQPHYDRWDGTVKSADAARKKADESIATQLAAAEWQRCHRSEADDMQQRYMRIERLRTADMSFAAIQRDASIALSALAAETDDAKLIHLLQHCSMKIEASQSCAAAAVMALREVAQS